MIKLVTLGGVKSTGICDGASLTACSSYTCEPKVIVLAVAIYIVRSYLISNTFKILYNVTRYNRIFNIRHKIAGNGSVSIEIPSL